MKYLKYVSVYICVYICIYSDLYVVMCIIDWTFHVVHLKTKKYHSPNST